MAHQRLETPEGTTAGPVGTDRGIDRLQCVPDPETIDGLGDLLAQMETPRVLARR